MFFCPTDTLKLVVFTVEGEWPCHGPAGALSETFRHFIFSAGGSDGPLLIYAPDGTNSIVADRNAVDDSLDDRYDTSANGTGIPMYVGDDGVL